MLGASGCGSRSPHSSRHLSSFVGATKIGNIWYAFLHCHFLTSIPIIVLIGGRLANESIHHPQIRPATHLHPRVASRRTDHRPSALPPLRTNSGRMRVRRPRLRSIRSGLQRLRRQHLGITRAATGNHTSYRDTRGCEGVWRG